MLSSAGMARLPDRPAPLANPLHRPRPPRRERLFSLGYYFANEQGRIAGALGGRLHLAADHLWLTEDLAIPLAAIETVAVLEKKRLLLPRSWLRLDYLNPISRRRETVSICTFDKLGLGFYRREPLEKLARLVEERRAAAPPLPAPDAPGAAPRHPGEARCEVCGARPAHYVGYVFLVGALVFWYRSAVRRRVHCARHVAWHGTAYYLVTALTGWLGLSALAYPFVTFAAGRALAPAIGRAWWGLALTPSIVLAAAVLRWALG